MEIRVLTEGEIKTWYKSELETSFPPQERKPLEVIIDLIKRQEYQVFGVFEDEKINDVLSETFMVGYVTIAKKQGINLLLIDYLGVSERKRNMGIGGKILGLVKSCFKDIPIVLESELPVQGEDTEENIIRERRINFYKRNGFRDVYEMATCGLRWQVLIGGWDIKGYMNSIEEIMKAHKNLYDELRYDVVIPLGKDEEPPKAFWGK